MLLLHCIWTLFLVVVLTLGEEATSYKNAAITSFIGDLNGETYEGYIEVRHITASRNFPASADETIYRQDFL